MTHANYLYRLFGKSPFRPLQQHMDKVQVCVSELVPLFKAVIAEDQAKVNAAQEKISALEREADQLKHELRAHLPRELFLPVPRADLLDLLRTQDNLANKAKDIAGIIRGRGMTFPESIGAGLLSFLGKAIEAAAQAHRAINELDELVEAGFRGNEVAIVEEMIERLDAIESDTDAMEVEIRAKLHEIERTLPPVDVMFIYKIIEWVGDLADIAERVGSRLALLLAR